MFETDLLSAYDTVVCLEFLEHVERDLEILGRIRGGTHFYGTVPNFPSGAHVRHFESAQEVYERYEKRFHELAVDTHLADTKGRLFFVMEGIIA